MKPYDRLRARLLECLLAMASHAETALARATRALVERDDGPAEEVAENAEALERFRREVEQVALQLLVMAPLARELRLITVAMKVAQNLARVGDEALAIARDASCLNADEPLKPYIDLPLISSIARRMLGDAIAAFVDGRPDRARALLPQDDDVDLLNGQLHRELASYMLERAANIPRCLHLMEIAKAFERVADHATSIAENVVYLYEGRDIRHGAVA